jgi:hypothetical protein
MPNPLSLDTVSSNQHPFGLPLGTVRAFMAVLILANFWMVLLWPGDTARPLLGHFFMLPLVLYSFTLSRDPRSQNFYHRILPFLLRLLLVGGTVAVIAFVVSNGVENYRERLTPDFTEFKDYWMPFSASLGIGLMIGIVLNALFGPSGEFFRTVRAWLSVVSMVMLSIELAMFVIHLKSSSGDLGFLTFLRNYQVFEIGIVSAYFGTRV